jgi:hypothetical protein
MPYTLYVIELKRKVARLHKFKKKNPDYAQAKPCVYVGMTSKTPEQRLQEHLTRAVGKKGNKLFSTMVARYGKKDGLIKRLYRNYQDIPTKALAEAAEKRRAVQLRKRGYGVWGGT